MSTSLKLSTVISLEDAKAFFSWQHKILLSLDMFAILPLHVRLLG